MSTVACKLRIFSAWVLMKLMSSCWLAAFSGAEVYCCWTLCERNRHPVRGSASATMKIARHGAKSRIAVLGFLRRSQGFPDKEYSGRTRAQVWQAIFALGD